MGLYSAAYITGSEAEAERYALERIRTSKVLTTILAEKRNLAGLKELVENDANIREFDPSSFGGSSSELPIFTTPPGARIQDNNAEEPMGRRFTPAFITMPNTWDLTLETRFRSISITSREQYDTLSSNGSQPIDLPLKPGYLLLMGLPLPGIVLLGVGYWLYSKEKPEPVVETQVSVARSFATVIPEIQESLEMETRSMPVSEPEPDLPPVSTDPELLYGAFIRGDEVGKGGMGTVYRCRSRRPKDKRVYALKILNKEWSDSADFRARFEREADICYKLNHENVVRAYERGEKDGRLWMVMDFISGGELRNWLREKARSQKAIIELFIKICDGLSHAHSQDVVHRDLKPDNILVVREEQRPVIADFGLAKGKHYDTITKTNTTLGTPIYMPPEQITGGQGGPRGDLYSLGCIMYEVFAGVSPFPDKDVLNLLNKKLMGEMPPEISEKRASKELQEIIFKLLSTNPDSRYQSAEEVRQALEKLKSTKRSTEQ